MKKKSLSWNEKYPNNLHLLHILWMASPYWTLLALGLSLCGALLVYGRVNVFAAFTDAALTSFAAGNAFDEILPAVILLLAVISAEQLLPQLMRYTEMRIRTSILVNFRPMLTEKIAHLPYKHIESKTTWELIQRVYHPAWIEPEELLCRAYQQLLGMIGSVTAMAGVLLLLGKQVWWAALAVLLILVPILVAAKKSGQYLYQAERDLSYVNRRVSADSNLLTNREAAKERAVFGFSHYLNRRFSDNFTFAQKVDFKRNAINFIRHGSATTVFIVVSVGTVGVLLYLLVQGRISVGMFLSLSTAFTSMVNSIAGLVKQTSQYANDLEYVADCAAVLRKESIPGVQAGAEEQVPDLKEIQVRHLRFRYPGTDRYIFKDLNLTFEKGKHYAIVGTNGAGKSTLIKLLLGLYEDYEGEILINGMELRQLPVPRLKALYSIVFQDFVHYQLTVRENLAFGAECRDSQLWDVLETVALSEKIRVCSDGLDTPLGKLEETGTELSGGQWQRLAIARSFLSKAPLRILDEPTAAMDPISESELYHEFDELSRGKTTIVITHRLASAQLADTIYLLEDGAVAESGSHEKLMERHGKYAEMYNAQRSWYK